MRNIELQTVPNALTPLQASQVSVFQKAFNVSGLGFDQFCTMMYWIEKFMAQAGADSLLNSDEFITILNDRTFNWKIRSTIDYSPAEIDAKYFYKMPESEERPGTARKHSSGDGGDLPLTEGDFFHTSAGFLQKKSDDYEGILATQVTDGPKPRKIIFNILDVNMDGHLTLTEFFELIKMYNVFNYLAGDRYKQNPWSITMQDFRKNVARVKTGIIIGFPSDNEKSLLDSLESMLITNEVNFKEFMIKFMYRKAFKPKEIANTLNAVSLVDLMSVFSR